MGEGGPAGEKSGCGRSGPSRNLSEDRGRERPPELREPVPGPCLSPTSRCPEGPQRGSPAGQVSSAVPLQRQGRPLQPAVLHPLQPAPDGLLDHDGGCPELVGPKLLQVGYLACPEEDLGAAKLELVRVLHKARRAAGSPSGQRGDVPTTALPRRRPGQSPRALLRRPTLSTHVTHSTGPGPGSREAVNKTPAPRATAR